MNQFIDMTGWKMWEHGVNDSRLTVIERVENNNRGNARWLCECNCDEHNRIVAVGVNIRNGNTKSCGCLQKERAIVASKKENKYVFNGDIVIGYTSNTNKEFYVDLKNFDKINKYCWHENIEKNGLSRICTNANNKTIRMHQLLGFTNYDHIDRNELNNLESNLRPCEHSENCRNTRIPKNNTSGIIGVSYDKKYGKWCAEIKFNYQRIWLGRFAIKDEAIKARLIAEAKYFKEFAPQRHLFEKYGVQNFENKEEEVM